MTLKAIKRQSKIFALRQIKSAQTPVLKKSGCGAVTACDDKCRLSGGSGGYHGVINVFLVSRIMRTSVSIASITRWTPRSRWRRGRSRW
jgi:hypothetical protein